jgi:hypothetical protein
MVNYKIFEIAGISIQTIVGVIFLLEQTSHLDVRSLFNTISPWFTSFRKNISTIPNQFTSFMTTIFLFVVIIAIALPWLSPSSLTIRRIPITIYGLIFFIFLSLGTYSAAVMSVLNQLLSSKKRLVPKSHTPTVLKKNFKIKTHVIDFWDAKPDSKEFNQAFTRANLIVWAVSLFEVALGFYALSHVLTNKNLIIIFLGIVTFAFLGPLLLTLLVSSVYLVERLFFRTAHWILSVWWQFLAVIWFLAGVLLVISALH